MSKKKSTPARKRSPLRTCQSSCLRETLLAKWIHRRKFIDNLAAENLLVAIFEKGGEAAK